MNDTSTSTDLGPRTLDELITQAEREGKWLRSCYQHVWFSPAELRAANAAGRFRWGVENWELFSPDALVAEKQREVQNAVEDYERTVARVGASRR